MKYKYIIALDPSGSFWEGKGTTGISIFSAIEKKFLKRTFISAKDFNTAEEYWEAHIKFLEENINKDTCIVIEDYLLYADKATQQINSRMETPKLIGILQHWCHMNNVPYYMQTASLVKKRWTDEILYHKGYLEKKGKRYTVCEHTRDSMRHAVHFATFKNE